MIERPDDIHDPHRVSGSVPERDARIREDGDEHVLLHVEGARVQRELAGPKPWDPKLSRRQNPSEEAANGQRRHLDGDLCDHQRLRAVGEELVEERHQGAGYHPHEPHPERVHRNRRVVGGPHRQPHLLDRRVLVVGDVSAGGRHGAGAVDLHCTQNRRFRSLRFRISCSFSFSFEKKKIIIGI